MDVLVKLLQWIFGYGGKQVSSSVARSAAKHVVKEHVRHAPKAGQMVKVAKYVRGK